MNAISCPYACARWGIILEVSHIVAYPILPVPIEDDLLGQRHSVFLSPECARGTDPVLVVSHINGAGVGIVPGGTCWHWHRRSMRMLVVC